MYPVAAHSTTHLGDTIMQSKIVAYAAPTPQGGRASMLLSVNVNVNADEMKIEKKQIVKEASRAIANAVGRSFSHCELITVEIL